MKIKGVIYILQLLSRFVIPIALLSFILQANFLLTESVVNGQKLVAWGGFTGIVAAFIYYSFKYNKAKKSMQWLIEQEKMPWFQRKSNYVITTCGYILFGMIFAILINNSIKIEDYRIDTYTVKHVDEFKMRYSFIEYYTLWNEASTLYYLPEHREHFKVGQTLKVTTQKGALGYFYVTQVF